MYCFFTKYNRHVFFKTGQHIKVNYQYYNLVCHCEKTKRFVISNLSSYPQSKSIRIIVHSSSTSYDNQKINLNLTKYRPISFRNKYSLYKPSKIFSYATDVRYVHFSCCLYADTPNIPSSKIEETASVMKEKAKVKKVKTVVKKPLRQRIKDEFIHYYHGFRLLFIDIKVACSLAMRVLRGHTLTRREYKLLMRTIGDMFRLVPFSVFLIVPFMELLLPLFIRTFPGLLPSTFQTVKDKEDRVKQSLMVKLKMAKFLQQTLDDMAAKGKGHSSETAKDFVDFFEKIRTAGGVATDDEIIKFSKLFRDEITLDSLTRPQLIALCKVLEIPHFGTTNFLCFQLRMRLRFLAADDRMIQQEGIDSLNKIELQQACRSRGMNTLGMSEEKLKAQLEQWLNLSLNEKVPPSLLLLSHAFMMPEDTTTTKKLAAAISALPDTVATKTKAAIGELQGKVDNKTKYEIIKEEVAKIQKEREEYIEEIRKQKLSQEDTKDKKFLVDKRQVLKDEPELSKPLIQKTDQISDENLKKEDISSTDLELVEDALDMIGKQKKKLLVVKEELENLKKEMVDYEKGVSQLKQVMIVSDAADITEVKESKGANRLSRFVNKIINKLHRTVHEIEKKEDQSLHREYEEHTSDKQLKVAELVESIKESKSTSDASQLKRINDALTKIDSDEDGLLKVCHLLRVLEVTIGENFKISKEQISEIIKLIEKEEAIMRGDFKKVKANDNTEMNSCSTIKLPELKDEKDDGKSYYQCTCFFHNAFI